MIDFIIYSDILLYQTKLKKIILDYMENKKINYNLLINKDSFTTNNHIYIIDLEYINSFNYIKKIKDKNSLIICFTYNLNNRNFLIQHHIKVDKIISKRKINYQKEFVCIFDQYLKNNQNKQKYMEYKDYKIPLDEIDSINILNDNLLISATNNLNQKYICNFDTTFNMVKNQLNENFQILNNYYVIQKKDKIKRKTKIYSHQLKTKIINLYNNGTPIKTLSELYEPSYTTIYNWIKINQYNNKLKDMEMKVKKYDSISKIVNDEVKND